LDFTVDSANIADAGSYTFKIIATATMLDGSKGNLSATFSIVLTIPNCA
jgi:hypothetical protein